MEPEIAKDPTSTAAVAISFVPFSPNSCCRENAGGSITISKGGTVDSPLKRSPGTLRRVRSPQPPRHSQSLPTHLTPPRPLGLGNDSNSNGSDQPKKFWKSLSIEIEPPYHDREPRWHPKTPELPRVPKPSSPDDVTPSFYTVGPGDDEYGSKVRCLLIRGWVE